MTTPTKTRGVSGIGAAATMAALIFGAMVFAPTTAHARVFVGFGFGFPIGFPGYYYPPYPYPYYPPPAAYPPPASYQPSAGYAPSGGYTPPAPTPPITYTPRPGWTNAGGQYCREYKSTQGTGSRATEKYGTACRDANGLWRIVN